MDQPQRDAVESGLAKAGVQTKRYFRPCHQMDAYFPFATQPLPVTEATYGQVLCLPLFADLEDRQIDMICALVEKSMATVSSTPEV